MNNNAELFWINEEDKTIIELSNNPDFILSVNTNKQFQSGILVVSAESSFVIPKNEINTKEFYDSREKAVLRLVSLISCDMAETTKRFNALSSSAVALLDSLSPEDSTRAINTLIKRSEINQSDLAIVNNLRWLKYRELS